MANENEERPSLHEVLDAAYDHHEQNDASDGGRSEPAPEPENAGAADAAALGEAPPAPDMPKAGRDPITGKFTRGGQPAGKGQPPAAARPQVAAAAAPPPPPAAAAPAIRPPQSWRPQEREALLKADPMVQQAVARRERQVAEVLQQTAQARQFQQEFDQMVGPYRHLMQAGGKSPMQSIQGLLQTVMALQTGPQQMKSMIAANIIRGYGIDINMLAAALDGQPGQPGMPAGQPPQMQYQPAPYRDPRVDALAGQMQEMLAERERQQQALDAEADAELDNFASTHPYLDTVIDEMYDMMAVATQRGVVLNYEDAYTRTIAALHPDLYEVMAQERAAAEASNPEGSTARAMAASSSVRGQPGIKPRPEDRKMDRREALEAAWDVHAGGGRV